MNFWNTLEIEPTNDKSVIKKAYAALTLKYHPEEHPDKFQDIHSAYLLALNYARKQKKLNPPPVVETELDTTQGNGQSTENSKKTNHDFFKRASEKSESTYKDSEQSTEKEQQEQEKHDFFTQSTEKPAERYKNSEQKQEQEQQKETHPYFEEEFDSLLEDWQSYEELTLEFEEVLRAMPNNTVSFAEQRIWTKFLKSPEFLEYTNIPNFSEILIDYVDHHQLRNAGYYRRDRLILSRLKRLPKGNKKNAGKIISHLQKKLLRGFKMMTVFMTVAGIILCFIVQLETNATYLDPIEEFYEEKYEINFNVEYNSLWKGTDLKDYYSYDVTWDKEEVGYDLDTFTTYVEKGSDELIILDDYMNNLLRGIATQFEISHPISFSDRYKNPSNYFQLTYDVAVGKDVFINTFMHMVIAIQQTRILDDTVIEIDIIPHYKDEDLLDQAISFQFVKSEKPDFQKLYNSLAEYDSVLEGEAYLYANELKSFYEKKYDNDFEVEYLGVDRNIGSEEFYVYDVTWKETENIVDINMFTTYIEKEIDEFIVKDDYMKILLETIATQFEIYQHICFDECVDSADYLQFSYNIEMGRDTFLSKVREVETHIQNTAILGGTVID